MLFELKFTLTFLLLITAFMLVTSIRHTYYWVARTKVCYDDQKLLIICWLLTVCFLFLTVFYALGIQYYPN